MEHFLLYGVSDDWAPVSEFEKAVRRFDSEHFSREFVLEVVRHFAESGYIRLGAFPGGGKSWEPWNVSIDEGIERIANGYNDVTGYLHIPDDQIRSDRIE
ncbi:hypothetical protein C5E45_22870 [Nocardia nova]|uniref:Uncharacterized protein n=1 Tax=Nocardia nova TaxID=37330 RepID=A0A2S6AL53_9NOCA|nr:hypothetical protein [Nocardia nova]PPJ31706.1 hypothetical protein C5E41_07405 [Nocardia nova]PPJ35946.1 hypothetical protein C5E45_22870 [Nocardia nova]